MNELVLGKPDDRSTAVVCRAPRVYVDGRRRRDLAVAHCESGQAPELGSAQLLLRPVAGGPSGKRFEDLPSLPPIGAAVRIYPGDSGKAPLFSGVVRSHRSGFGEEDERLGVEVEQRIRALLSDPMHSRWQIADDEPVEVPDAPVRFNSSQGPLASRELVAINGRYTFAFDTSASAERWTVAKALSYLLATTAPTDVEIPGPTDLEALAGDIDLGTLDVTGQTALKAVVSVAGRGGLSVRSNEQGSALAVYRPGRIGRRRSVRLQPAGSMLSPTHSNLSAGEAVFRGRPSRRGVLARGEHKQYESTFVLARGWDPALETTRWRDFVRSQAADWEEVADVYRKWVLNEHGRYSGEPWALDVYDFSGIDSDDFLVTAPRRFLPCLSTDASGQSLGVVVDYRTGPSAAWKRWTGPVWISAEECGLYLGGDALPGEYFQAAASGQAQVRVTATVTADTRVAAVIQGDEGAPRHVVDLADRAAWRKVHTSSVFHNHPAVGEPNERDDAELLYRAAMRYAQTASTSTQAELRLARIDESYRVGDIVERIDGRALELSSNPEAGPAITSVRHDFENWQTTLHLSG